MREQADAYGRLEAACQQLASALVRGEPSVIESLVRAGESEMLRMRSRLVQITLSLTAFADARSQASEPRPVAADARAAFESASKKLFEAARSFQTIQRRAESLARGGSTFATACIEFCGVPPTTYRAPYVRRGGEARWA